MSHRVRNLLLVGCALTLAWLIAQSVMDFGVGCLFLAPAVLLAMPLIAGRYLGAEHLSRLASSRLPRRRRASGASHTPRMWGLTPPRGGLLMAAALAVRPPPLRIAAR
jgi:hypothetical protein